MKTAIINARVRPELKEDVEAILARLGITATQAITMFYEQIRMKKGIPFELIVPDENNKNRLNELPTSRNSVDLGALATKHFGPENGVELELPEREILDYERS